MQRERSRKRRVCVLGAGPSGLSAAWALSDVAGRDRFDVHVYQMGWRAGGRAASAQNPSAGFRIEQNGSHYLFGSYHSTFELVRAVYDELEPDRPFGRLEDEFTPRNLLVGKRSVQGGFQNWFQFMPTNLSRPDRGGKYALPFDYVWMALQTLLRMLLGMLDYGSDPARTARLVTWLLPLSPFKQDTRSADARAAALRVFLFVPALVVNYPIAWSVRVAWKAVSFCYQRIFSTYTKRRLEQRAMLWFQAKAVIWRARIRTVFKWTHDFAVRESLGQSWIGRNERLATLWELAFAFLVGVGTDELWRAGRLERVDEEDFRTWLARHGCAPEAIGSPYVKCWYDAVAAYEDGDIERPSISAAVSVYAIVRALLTYKGNFAYQMRHEVGDGVIAPLVMALRKRGVTFHFFHRVRDVVPGVDADGKAVIDRIDLEPQLPDGVHMGACLVPNPDGRPCWPYEPQLVGGGAGPIPTAEEFESFYTLDSERRISLNRGPDRDFDDVVFALPLPAIAHDAPSLLHRPEWMRMATQIKTTDTVSLRIWFVWTLERLGWKDPAPILSGYDSPFSTWEDNSHNLDHSDFPPGRQPQAIATVFGPLESPTFAPAPGPLGNAYVRRQRALANTKANAFYDSAIGHLWPNLVGANGLCYEAFCDLSVPAHPPDAGGVARRNWQFLRANVGPLERYTLALPSTLKDRLRPDESGYVNMSLAGEWTRNGVEVGCMEGAVISGLAAARALSGRPVEILGEHDLEFGLFAPIVGSQIRPAPHARGAQNDVEQFVRRG
jgi:uncharacterized protein with NAD-binding domain and iron-sulfur cluster